MQTTLLWLALAVYGLGIVLTLPSLVHRRASLPPATLAALGLGLVLHALVFAVPASHLHRLPVTDVRSALSFFAFLMTVAFFFAYLLYRIAALGIFMLPMVFLLTLISALRPKASYYRLPSLEVCDEIYYRSLVFGLPLLSIGILTGFVWASRTWTGPWELDPKILASIVTWLIYLTLFSTRLAGSWRGRRAAYVAIVGFAAVMMTFLGASLLSGQHGYVPKGGGVP